ncbi:MAG: ribosomal L7Ae/L30e/S12e/Gadd45 family protein [Selenomonas sp.]|nr:ribosomal L7Ae/L30e/S12e/Gadd45 family protein [Selenomonas sp.]
MAKPKEQRITNLLSMAQKAGRIVSGAFAVEQAVKKKQAVLVLLAEDAAEESKKNFTTLADKFAIPYAACLDRETLGRCLGKDFRAVAALLDDGFAKKIRQLMEESL